MIQPSLFDYIPPEILGFRDGTTFEPKRDGARLNGQAADVYNFMKSGEWVSLKQISEATGHPEASCSARFRDLRKPHLGNFKTERRNLGGGKWVYRLCGERG